MADPIAVEYIHLEEGSFLLKFPETPPWFWNMSGYYLPAKDGSTFIKLSNEEAKLLMALR